MGIPLAQSISEDERDSTPENRKSLRERGELRFGYPDYDASLDRHNRSSARSPRIDNRELAHMLICAPPRDFAAVYLDGDLASQDEKEIIV